LSTAAITVENVTKSFGEVRALDGVSLEIERGEIYGLLGPNGSGKTTLIRMLVGLVEPDSGSISVRGRTGYMTQAAALYDDLSVEENVSFFADANGAAGGAADDAMRVVQLHDRRRSVVRTLSGGMRQRCSLACALVHRPDVLLLDEPTVGVDPQLRVQFWEHFHRLAAGGTTIVVSSHVMDEAERAQRLGLIRDGHLIAEGTAGDLRRQAGVERLEDAFLKLSGQPA
jgi:ABC-2 type transport system ATP-binding protein